MDSRPAAREHICGICHDVAAAPVLTHGCHHIFNESCLQYWANKRPVGQTGFSCPLCRSFLLPGRGRGWDLVWGLDGPRTARSQAAQGCLESQRCLGTKYAEELMALAQAEKSGEPRKVLLLLADEAGSGYAALDLGRMAETHRDFFGAFEFYMRASARNHRLGSVYAARVLLKTMNIFPEPGESGRHTMTDSGRAQVINLLAPALGADVPEAFLVLAYMQAAEERYVEAFVNLLHAVARDCAWAITQLGTVLLLGLWGRDKNESEACQWLAKAADLGDARAMAHLAYASFLGQGCPQNKGKGVELYLRAAEAGSTVSMLNLAKLWTTPKATKEELGKGIYWCRRAADQGEPHAYLLLAEIYLSKRGEAPLDLAEARKYAGEARRCRAPGHEAYLSSLEQASGFSLASASGSV